MYDCNVLHVTEASLILRYQRRTSDSLASVLTEYYVHMLLVASGAADEDAYLSDDSVDPDDMTYEVTHAQTCCSVSGVY